MMIYLTFTATMALFKIHCHVINETFAGKNPMLLGKNLYHPYYSLHASPRGDQQPQQEPESYPEFSYFGRSLSKSRSGNFYKKPDQEPQPDLQYDLSKAFDSVDHDLLLVNLNAYGINLDALQLLRSYLSKKHQRVNVNSTFGYWKEIRFGVPQGSVLGPSLFNVFVNDTIVLVRCTNISNYADDTTIFACHPTF